MDDDDSLRQVAVVLVGSAQGWARVGPVDARGRCDVEVVDQIAQLLLVAGRLGWVVRLAEVSPELEELLHLTGLAQVCRPFRG